MRVVIRTADGFRLYMPVPARLAGFVVKKIPESVIVKMKEDIPEPYKQLVTKENICMAVEACMDVLKENKGLEAVHVEAEDGTYVSIRL